MIRSYFIACARYFLKNRLFTLINLVGLATGMAAFILIFHYTTFEKGYDQFHENKEAIYRVASHHLDEEGSVIGKYAVTNPGFGPMMKRYFSEVKEYARLVHTLSFMPKPVLSYRSNKFYEDKIYYADQSFLQMFSYPLISGDRRTALSKPRSIIISESTALKYFGLTNPVGKILTLDMGARGKLDLEVTGVMRDFPANTHLHVDMLVSFNTFPANWNLDEYLDWADFYVYLQIHDGKDMGTITSNLPKFLTSVLGKDAKYYQMFLQNIQDIHLYSNLTFEAKPTGDGSLMDLLLLVGIVILVVAWINYINLTAAKSIEYAKQAGLRKMFGASKGQLCLQHIVNALVINLLALLVAFSLSQLLQPFLSRITAMPANVGLFDDKIRLFPIFILVLFGGILSGLYPAFLLSGQSLDQLVRGNFSKGTKGKLTRQSLVVFQFVISVTLIALTLTVFKQVKHMQNKDLGMNIDQVLVVKGPASKDSTYFDQWEAFVNRISEYNQVKAVAASTDIPGRKLGWGRGLYRPDKESRREVPTNIIATEADFFNLYDMKFLAGRNFSLLSNDPGNSAILNEEAVKMLGFSSPGDAIDEKVMWDENGDRYEFKIIGVIRNFNQRSPKQPHEAIIFPLHRLLNPPWTGAYYSIKLRKTEYDIALKHIKNAWLEILGDNPFDYFFLDAFFERQYKADQQFGQVFSIFTLLAIVIANLGLLGLFSYTVVQKTKEIGIRKVLGASEFSIAKLLSYEYVRLIIIALAIALPIAFYAAGEWLRHFTYRIDLGWWFYVLPFLATLMMLVITLTLQLIRTARTHPVEALRNE